METAQLQQQLFKHIKAALPPHLSLPDALGDLLNLSPDSVYRRIRGEKPLSLGELQIICQHYKLSIDQLLNLSSDSFVFHAPDFDGEKVPFVQVLKGMLMQLQHFNSFGQKEMLYLCKDMPMWQFYLYPELGAFKSFVWAKTIHNDPALAGKGFSLNEHTFDDCNAVGRQMLETYNLIPSVELWNEESINSTISQIKYFKDSGGFHSRADLLAVVESLERTLTHLKMQCEQGVKFMPGAPDTQYKSSIQLYVNEIVIGTNTIMVELDGTKLAFLTYNVFNYMHTRNQEFNERVFRGFHTLRSRSALISGTGEKERNRFYNSLLMRVQLLKD
jgi:hypothetical protein